VGARSHALVGGNRDAEDAIDVLACNTPWLQIASRSGQHHVWFSATSRGTLLAVVVGSGDSSVSTLALRVGAAVDLESHCSAGMKPTAEHARVVMNGRDVGSCADLPCEMPLPALFDGVHSLNATMTCGHAQVLVCRGRAFGIIVCKCAVSAHALTFQAYTNVRCVNYHMSEACVPFCLYRNRRSLLLNCEFNVLLSWKLGQDDQGGAKRERLWSASRPGDACQRGGT
jgi:hypothetical protein